ELAILLSRSAIAVTNDSGPMHLAVALNKPVVTIFGPTDPVWIGPYGRPHAVVRAPLNCSPCYLKKISACPHAHACMTEVTADQVMHRVQSLLGKSERWAC